MRDQTVLTPGRARDRTKVRKVMDYLAGAVGSKLE